MTAEKEAIQDSFDLGALYDLQSSAVERFSKVSAAFAIVASIDDQGVCVDLMRNILFHDSQAGAKKRDVNAALRTFAKGLRAYTRQEANPTNDRKVRESWTAIETLMWPMLLEPALVSVQFPLHRPAAKQNGNAAQPFVFEGPDEAFDDRVPGRTAHRRKGVIDALFFLVCKPGVDNTAIILLVRLHCRQSRQKMGQASRGRGRRGGGPITPYRALA